MTNNSMHYRADYVDPARGDGRAGHGGPVVSSRPGDGALPRATTSRRSGACSSVGASGLERELRDVGLRRRDRRRMPRRGCARRASTAGRRPAHPDAVVIGLDPNLTYLRLAAAADCIRAGARFIATNRDPVYPTERGLRPGAGTIVAALEAASGVDAAVDRQARAAPARGGGARRSGATPAEAIMIGDGIGTDIAAARAVGARCVLMLTGVTTRRPSAPATAPTRSPRTDGARGSPWTGSTRPSALARPSLRSSRSAHA